VQGGFTACDTQRSDYEYIIALNAAQFASHILNENPSRHSLCGGRIHVVNRCSDSLYGSLDVLSRVFKNSCENLDVGVELYILV
jgi:hypothetical protein